MIFDPADPRADALALSDIDSETDLDAIAASYARSTPTAKTSKIKISTEIEDGSEKSNQIEIPDFDEAEDSSPLPPNQSVGA